MTVRKPCSWLLCFTLLAGGSVLFLLCYANSSGGEVFTLTMRRINAIPRQ